MNEAEGPRLADGSKDEAVLGETYFAYIMLGVSSRVL